MKKPDVHLFKSKQTLSRLNEDLYAQLREETLRDRVSAFIDQ